MLLANASRDHRQGLQMKVLATGSSDYYHKLHYTTNSSQPVCYRTFRSSNEASLTWDLLRKRDYRLNETFSSTKYSLFRKLPIITLQCPTHRGLGEETLWLLRSQL